MKTSLLDDSIMVILSVFEDAGCSILEGAEAEKKLWNCLPTVVSNDATYLK